VKFEVRMAESGGESGGGGGGTGQEDRNKAAKSVKAVLEKLRHREQ
jgi:hypothetical protein